MKLYESPASASGVPARCIRSCRDLVSQIPKLPVRDVLHTLLQDLDRRSHGPDLSATDDPLRQLEMMEAEQLHQLVKIQHAFGHIVQTEELFVPPIDVIMAQALGYQLFL